MSRGWLVLAVVLVASCGGDDGDGGGGGDAGPPDAAIDPAECADIAAQPMTLAETGLYCDPAAETLGVGVRPFAPQYELWSDGASKRRWVYLPPGETIDTSDMDDWIFPPGTKLWKEFTRDGVRVETRMLERYGPNPVDWNYWAFEWNLDGTEATRLNGIGRQDALGTDHDIPSLNACITCHTVGDSVAIGFSAILLDYPAAEGELDLATLAEEGLLSANPTGFTPGATGPFYPIPGAGTEVQPALGYMHTNCGGCHNPKFGLSNMVLSLPADVAVDTPEETPAYLTTIDVLSNDGATDRVEAASPSQSRVYVRMQELSMPTVGVETVDTTGLAAVEAWICSLGQSAECGNE